MAKLLEESAEELKKRKVRAVLAKMRGSEFPFDESSPIQPEQDSGILAQPSPDSGEIDLSSIEQDRDLSVDEEEMKRQLAKRIEARLLARSGGKRPK